MVAPTCGVVLGLRQRWSLDDYREGRPLQPRLRGEALHLHRVPAGARAEAVDDRCDQVMLGFKR